MPPLRESKRDIIEILVVTPVIILSNSFVISGWRSCQWQQKSSVYPFISKTSPQVWMSASLQRQAPLLGLSTN